EMLANLPSRPVQPEPHDVNHQSRPHPGAAPLKMLTGWCRRDTTAICATRELCAPSSPLVARGWHRTPLTDFDCYGFTRPHRNQSGKNSRPTRAAAVVQDRGS
ncbi:hypothetical protein M2283_008488, partial [Streptomyces pseudovenezuelae]|nr:hypothetical protein [Streptomyces pseudovenezuelae]